MRSVEKNLEKFRDRMRDLRTDKGLSMTQLGSALGLSHVYISRWEMGKWYPSIVNIILLAQFFGCSTDYLLGLVD